MPFRPGELDQRIKLEEKTSVDDGLGGSADTWTEVAEVWAHVKPKGGNEKTEFDQVNAVASYLFVIRNGLVVKPSYRIVWAGEVFNIRAPKKPKPRALYMEIDGEQGVAQ